MGKYENKRSKIRLWPRFQAAAAPCSHLKFSLTASPGLRFASLFTPGELSTVWVTHTYVIYIHTEWTRRWARTVQQRAKMDDLQVLCLAHEALQWRGPAFAQHLHPLQIQLQNKPRQLSVTKSCCFSLPSAAKAVSLHYIKDVPKGEKWRRCDGLDQMLGGNSVVRQRWGTGTGGDAQKSCGCLIHGGAQGQDGKGPEQPDLVGGIPTHRWSLSLLPTQTILHVVEHL